MALVPPGPRCFRLFHICSNLSSLPALTAPASLSLSSLFLLPFLLPSCPSRLGSLECRIFPPPTPVRLEVVLALGVAVLPLEVVLWGVGQGGGEVRAACGVLKRRKVHPQAFVLVELLERRIARTPREEVSRVAASCEVLMEVEMRQYQIRESSRPRRRGRRKQNGVARTMKETCRNEEAEDETHHDRRRARPGAVQGGRVQRGELPAPPRSVDCPFLASASQCLASTSRSHSTESLSTLLSRVRTRDCGCCPRRRG
ncbi:hypothetical protein FIBSPDRAFT_931942, partial [Athelia psychrophila]